MASEYRRLLDPSTAKATVFQELREAWDAGAYRVLEVHVRVLKAGTGGNIILQHAAVNEEDAYLDLANASTALNGQGAYLTISNFLRFIRWRTDGAVAGSPVVMIEIIAKQ